jgi:hypothetical protein
MDKSHLFGLFTISYNHLISLLMPLITAILDFDIYHHSDNDQSFRHASKQLYHTAKRSVQPAKLHNLIATGFKHFGDKNNILFHMTGITLVGTKPGTSQNIRSETGPGGFDGLKGTIKW